MSISTQKFITLALIILLSLLPLRVSFSHTNMSMQDNMPMQMHVDCGYSDSIQKQTDCNHCNDCNDGCTMTITALPVIFTQNMPVFKSQWQVSLQASIFPHTLVQLFHPPKA